ncbi:pyridoxine 5'-phosphate synthase [Candidatus Latescibacterota bacterium]
MPYLSVNIDYVAVIREARQTDEPDPVIAAGIVELAGAHGITAHLREDRRHIVDRDIRLLRETVTLPFNMEMAATEEMLSIASEVVPDLVTFVPEKRQEITTEGGVDVISNRELFRAAVDRMHDKRIVTSLFIDPDPAQIDVSREVGAHCIELHTGEYAMAKNPDEQEFHLTALMKAARHAADLGIEVHAGHGLTYKNVSKITMIREIKGLYIGHSIMSRAVYVGLEKAVRDMLRLLQPT